MQSEIAVANPDGALSSGLYAQITFRLTRAAPPLLVPANALVIWPKGTFVAVVDDNSVVHYPAVLIGRDARALGEALEGACDYRYAASLEAAVEMAATLAEPGDTVLLSPACASLDMFRDYAHRGSVFAAAVQRLAA